MKKFLGVTLLAGTLLFNTASTSAAPAPIKDRETIYQVALLQSLAMGYFDGSISVKDLKTHGDTGIGTFEGLNGEMIVLDGVVYRANQDLKINVMGDKETVPFSNVTFFDKDFSVKLSNVADKSAIHYFVNCPCIARARHVYVQSSAERFSASITQRTIGVKCAAVYSDLVANNIYCAASLGTVRMEC